MFNGYLRASGYWITTRQRTRVRFLYYGVEQMKKNDQAVLSELVELEKKTLEVSVSNGKIFSNLLESIGDHRRKNLILSIIALNFACSLVALFI